MANLLSLNTSMISSSSSQTLRRPALHLTATRTRVDPRIRAKLREIFMPALSSTMTEGKIVSWIKSEGEKLSKGDPVVVVESDKADMDVETFYDGFLAKILVDEGSVAPVGSAIAYLAESQAEIADAITLAASSTAPPPAVQAEQPIIQEAPTSTPTSSPSPSSPPPLPLQPVLQAAAVLSSHPASEGGKRIVASPYAKKLGKELGVDLRTVLGTGPNGRIVAKDVEAAAARVPEPILSNGAPASTASVQLGTTVPFNSLQESVSSSMLESLTVPAFRVGYTITTDALNALYKKIKSKGVNMTALIVKATALALAQHPVVNSSCRDGKSFTYNSKINIAVAVATDHGLVTPVLNDADKVDIYTLSRKWNELVEKAHANQLQPNECNTGTFSITDLGEYDVDRFDTILPPGTGASMAVGASEPAVVATKDGRIGMKHQMQVNVTADHRVIYGADLAAFLQTLSKIIEDPKDLTF